VRKRVPDPNVWLIYGATLLVGLAYGVSIAVVSLFLDGRGHNKKDIATLAECGLNAFRFGIEWARIEPAQGEFSLAALGHYRRVLDACHEHGVVPLVTFHHFTVPRWLHDLGGLAYERFPALFERYCSRVAAALGDRIRFACTINEPQGLGFSGWLLGINPPGHTDDREGAQRVVDNLLEAHRLGAAAIRSEAGIPTGVTLALPDIQYEDGAQPGESSLELESRVNDWFLELARTDDFIGVQTYTRFRIGPDGPRSPGHDWSDLSRELVETDEVRRISRHDRQVVGQGDGSYEKVGKASPRSAAVGPYSCVDPAVGSRSLHVKRQWVECRLRSL